MTPRSTLRTLVVLVAFTLLVSNAPASANHIREGNVRFKVTCNYSHSLPDDPIVFPGRPGASHLHDFAGKVGVNATTTSYSALVNGDDITTCNDPADLASYWVPALYANGVKVNPTRMTGYYRRGNKHGDIKPYPDGLKIVSDKGGWQCNESPQTSPLGCKADIKLRVDFPDCWDGVNLDSADHRSHMAYSIATRDANVCPGSHPVPVPRLTIYVNYHLSVVATVFTLASGAVSGLGSTVHGDFFNGWERDRLIERIETCLNQLQRCDSGG